MSKFLTALLKKSLNFSAAVLLSEIICLLSTRVMLSLVIFLSEKKGFTVFQKVLVSEIRDGFRLL